MTKKKDQIFEECIFRLGFPPVCYSIIVRRFRFSLRVYIVFAVHEN